jgi:hypothetical protein
VKREWSKDALPILIDLRNSFEASILHLVPIVAEAPMPNDKTGPCQA